MTHICVGNLTIIGSDNGLSPGRRQAIIWTNAGILLIGSSGTDFSEIFNQNFSIFLQEHAFESVVCEMAAILSQPQGVNADGSQAKRRLLAFNNKQISWISKYALHVVTFVSTKLNHAY